jgi:hypothetical protein
MPVKFPGPEDRTAVIGRTGSGKTTAAAWHLSGKDFERQPWLIVDTKGDPFLNRIRQIEGVKTIGVLDTPGDNGLYIVSPLPAEQIELDAMFRRIWEKQNCGVYIDEGYMIETTDGLNALLTQGRTRRIPMIILSQRPAWITKFVFSEADYVQLFNLQRLEDRKNVAGLVPVDKNYRLAKYCSYWYNVADDDLREFLPVPSNAVILDTFRAKFPPEQAQAGQPPAVRKRVAARVI